MSARFYVSYYGPDGTGSSMADESIPALDGQEFTTEEAARCAVVTAIGGKSRGTWWPGDEDLPEGHESVIAYHENQRAGCGGYVIVRAEQTK